MNVYIFIYSSSASKAPKLDDKNFPFCIFFITFISLNSNFSFIIFLPI